MRERVMTSPTHGKLTISQVIIQIKNYIEKHPENTYKITIGSDSQNHRSTKMVLVIAVWRVGYGGIFFYETKNIKKITNLNQKIYYETSLSLDFAQEMVDKIAELYLACSIEIHVDIGDRGDTRKMIPEITGWVKGCGFKCKIKPDSYTASGIANMISK